MSSQIIPVEPFDYVVFGGTGDLAERKLLPALYHRQMEGQFSEPTRIIGASRATLSHDDYRKFATDALKEHLKPGSSMRRKWRSSLPGSTTSRSTPSRSKAGTI